MTFLFWGFTALWIVIVAYVWSLVVRQRKLAEDIVMLGEVLEREQTRRAE